jgi:ribosomal protein S24E
MYDELEAVAELEHSNRCVLTRQAVALFLSQKLGKVSQSVVLKKIKRQSAKPETEVPGK